MQETYFAPTLFDGNQLLNNQYIIIENGKIKRVSSEAPTQIFTTLDGIVCPGLIDVQVNGGGGVLFNQTPTEDSLHTMAIAHQQYGTTSMLPTVITDDLIVMQAAANSVSATIESLTHVIGIHFEGPHLSKPKRGIHPSHHIRSVTDQELALFCRKDMGSVVVTLAPENVPCDIIADLVKQGVIVCLGHSNADAETVMAALAAGATGFTHLFNAMSPLTSRAPGMVGAALADELSYCGLIIDLHHVDPLSCKAAIRAKQPKHTMLVTDAMSHVGTQQTTLDYCDTHINRQGDKLTLPDGTLAGSALDMIQAVRNCHQIVGISIEDSLAMATSSPAHFLGKASNIGHIAQGANANMLLLSEQLNIEKTWINGELTLS